MLARTFRQMLIILEKNVRDSRAIWAVLWQGFRMPPFAAEDLIRQARRYKSRPTSPAPSASSPAPTSNSAAPPPTNSSSSSASSSPSPPNPNPPPYDPTHQFAMELVIPCFRASLSIASI
jgi:DNA polymerase-3 subunit delta